MSMVHPRFLVGTMSCCLLWLSTSSAATLPAGFSETRVATGLASPTAMAVAPDVVSHSRQHDIVPTRNRGWTADIRAPFSPV